MITKRFIIVIVFFSLILISFFYFGYYYIYPKMVAQAVVSKKYTAILPKEYRDEFHMLSDTINIKVSKLMQVTENKGITIDDLLKAVDEIREKDVRNALQELYQTDLTSIEQVYLIGRKHIRIETFDPDLLKAAFLKHVKMHHVERGLKYIKRHDLENKLDVESGRRIVKQIIIQKKDKIIKKSDVKDK